MKEIDIPLIERKEDIINNNNVNSIQNSYSFYQYKEGYVTNMYSRYMRGLDFTKEDLIYLYHIYYQAHKLTEEEKRYLELMCDYIYECRIAGKRHIYYDLAKVFDCTINEITDNQETFKNNPDRYVVLYASLDLNEAITCNNLRYIQGSLNGYYCNGGTSSFSSLEGIGGNVIYNYYYSNMNLNNLKFVGGDLNYWKCKYISGLSNLEVILGSACFDNIESAEGLEKLSFIGGNAGFYALKDAKGLSSLEYIGMCSNFQSLVSSEGFENLKYTGFTPNFKSLRDDDKLKILKRVQR